MRVEKMRVSLLIMLVLFAVRAGTLAQTPVKVDANTFGGLSARAIGPAVMSGRIMAIDAVNSNPNTFWVGTASGGVWKSTNGGTTFKPIFDKHTQSIGAIAIDQSKPDTVWVGTGESCTRNSSSVGTGLYKTTDGGENWKLMGLEKSERISKVIIDPKNPNTVYVAVAGHLWDSHEERGVYKTTDGGATWQRVLYVDANTGCSDLAIDPQETNIIYAAMWQFRRQPYTFSSGGPGSGLHKSTDGGKTWKKLTRGLPEGELGRIAIALAPSRPNVIYANVESKKTALYRSDDMGETWTQTNRSFNIAARPFYFSHLVVDPKDHKLVYKPGFTLTVSKDGGQTFTGIGGSTHSDEHAFWINPNNTSHLIMGTDGGIYISYDQGGTWVFLKNLPVSQFYHVAYDMERPYNVYGGLQDNGSWMGPSSSPGGIQNKSWKNVGFGDGFYTFPDPKDKNIVYCEFQGGRMLRHHLDTGELKYIVPLEREGDPKYRFNWNTPILISKRNPNTIYIGSQFLFRSNNKGESWEKISGDLTTNNPEKQKQEESGGITVDNSTAENHCTIFTISESPLDEKVIWAGTDDGNLQITVDGGKNWTNVVSNIPGLPANTWCSGVEASNHDRATAYAVFDGHQTGDMKVYVYKTSDFGKTWKSLASDAIQGYAHVIREDLVKPDLLYLGTEFGLFISIDGGKQWGQFKGNLPNVAVRDIAIHTREHDLILATHGRGIYIVDDITPLRQFNDRVLASNVHVFEPRTTAVRFPQIVQDFPGDEEFVGSNPSEVAYITYYLKERHLIGDFKVEIYNSEGKLMATLPGSKRKGINRVEWYMRLKPPKVAPAPTLAGGALFGPIVPEGEYTVKILKGNETYTGKVILAGDPRLPHSDADRKLQQETVLKLYRMQERLAYVGASVTAARDQARERAKKLQEATPAAAPAKKGKKETKEDLGKTLETFANKLDALNKTLVATKEGYAIHGEEQLRERVVEVYQSVSIYGGRPTESQIARLSVLEKEIEKANQDYETIVGKELESINAALTAKQMEPIKLLTKEEFDKKEGN